MTQGRGWLGALEALVSSSATSGAEEWVPGNRYRTDSGAHSRMEKDPVAGPNPAVVVCWVGQVVVPMLIQELIQQGIQMWIWWGINGLGCVLMSNGGRVIGWIQRQVQGQI